MPAPPPAPAPQLSFDELGTPLREVTFVVLDLETTGGSAERDRITEVGAVKVRGGERIGELATLVDPGTGIPPQVVALTGITTALVTGAPRLPQVLPSVLEFLGGGVLVAHNAPFDAGFLRAACERHGAAWPRPPVLCTARLARAVLSRDEAPSVKLAALAELFGTSTRPTHRALADARATVEVLHHLLERIGNLGVQSLEELLTLVRDASPHRPTERQRHKRHLAGSVPSAPGVYLFRGARDEVLYVGTSGDLRRRVRSYFTAGERRRRIRDMVAQAERVDTIVCAHALEAGVHELRLIAAHRPRYNRRSRNPNATWWVTATAEAFPRLSVVPTPRDGALGPVPLAARRARGRRRRAGRRARCGRARCGSRRADAHAGPCALYELRRCAAPCAGHQDVDGYAPAVAAWRRLVDGADDGPLHTLADEVTTLAGAGAVRGGRPRPRPARRAGRGARPGPAARRARGPGGGGRGPPGRQRGLGAGRGAPRPARRGRGGAPGRVADAGGRGAARRRHHRPAGAGAAARGGRRGGTAAAPLAHRRRHPPGALRPAVGGARARGRWLGGVGAAGTPGGGCRGLRPCTALRQRGGDPRMGGRPAAVPDPEESS